MDIQNIRQRLDQYVISDGSSSSRLPFVLSAILNGLLHCLLHCLLLGLLLSAHIVHAHESPEHELERLKIRLRQVSSGNSGEPVKLLLRRADLHRRQRDWNAALSDYQQIAEQNPDNPAMMLGRARLHLDQHQYESAIHWTTRILQLNPAYPLASLNYARALAGIGNIDAASMEFRRAIANLDSPSPEHYIEHARVLLDAKNSRHTRRLSIDILDKGADALGHPVSLHELAYELELNSENFETALHRVEKVLAHNSSLLNWRMRRATLLFKTERHPEALSETVELLHKIQSLPVQRRGTRAIQIIKQRAKALLVPTNQYQQMH